MPYDGDRRNDARDSQPIGRTEFQDNTARNDDYLRRGDQETSVGNTEYSLSMRGQANADVDEKDVSEKPSPDIAAQVKNAVEGNVPHLIDARNRYELQQATINEGAVA